MSDNVGVRVLVCAALLLVTVTAAGACTGLRARTQPDRPPLEIPAPPPRIVMPAPADPLPPAPTNPIPPAAVADPPAAPPPGERPRPAAPRPEQVEAPPPQTEQPALTLGTTTSTTEVERRVRALMTNAARDLDRIDYGALGVDARAQYDIAKRFREQAAEALKAGNLLFAEQLASKAASLAGLLLQQ